MFPRGIKELQNSNGPSTDPWGTPQVKKDFNNLDAVPDIPR